MQPYFFPYIGYYQLMQAVDEFVLYDNVQFIKDGWIHRNRLLVNGSASMFTLPLEKGEHTAPINERCISSARWPYVKRKLLVSIQQNYQRAPFFDRVYPLIESCINSGEVNLFLLIKNSIEQVVKYLELDVKLSTASSIEIDHQLINQEKVLALCDALKADEYINAEGGKSLYDKKAFCERGVTLQFLQCEAGPYQQQGKTFVSSLSIIDVLMNNPPQKIHELLAQYTLV